MFGRTIFLLLFLNNMTGFTKPTNFNMDRNFVKYFLFREYQSYDHILNYLRSLPLIYPDHAKKLIIGYSSEGREIPAIRISWNVEESNRNPIILVDAGMHAREWMSVAVALYLIYQLIEDKENHELFYYVDWIIIPVLNPDGYEYSLSKDPTWRKTTCETNDPNATKCTGVDINRNFDIFWNKFGSSQDPCHDNYAGPNAFSEPETKALRDLAYRYSKQIKLYISLHAYGNLILYPWSYTNKSLDNHSEHQVLGEAVAREIGAFRGTRFGVGSTNKLLYAVSGSSSDWMAAEIGVPLIYAIELPKTSGDFQPFEEDIVPTAEETFQGFETFHAYVSTKWDVS